MKYGRKKIKIKRGRGDASGATNQKQRVAQVKMTQRNVGFRVVYMHGKAINYKTKSFKILQLYN
jgi:hypothetical protein